MPVPTLWIVVFDRSEMPRPNDRDRQRQIEPVGHPIGQGATELAHGCFDRVDRLDDVGAPPTNLEVIVREDRRHRYEWDAVEVIE